MESRYASSSKTAQRISSIIRFTRATGPALGLRPPDQSGGAGIIVTMNENEIPIAAAPRTAYMDVLVISLNEESIAARIVPIESVDPADRPIWACTPGDEVYVAV